MLTLATKEAPVKEQVLTRKTKQLKRNLETKYEV
jgi:hypothetical protein